MLQSVDCKVVIDVSEGCKTFVYKVIQSEMRHVLRIELICFQI